MDHSLTYTQLRLRNLPHRIRLRSILSIIKNAKIDHRSWADVGCSNGFIIASVLNHHRPSEIFGFDHDSSNLEAARSSVPRAVFNFIDLNRREPPDCQFDVVTCFEVLEHVGDLRNAVGQLLAMTKRGGTTIITLPIEVGFGGILKFFVKRYLYRYSIEELPCGESGMKGYVIALLKGHRISTFRTEQRNGWGTHFGFDWRDVEDILRDCNIEFAGRGNLFTRYIIIHR